MIWASDLTDAQWQTIQEVLPPDKGGRTGRPRTYPLHEIGNAVFYQARTGWAWRHLPHDFAPHDFAPHDFAPHDFAPHDFAPHDFAPHGDGWDHFHRWLGPLPPLAGTTSTAGWNHFHRWRDGGLIERVQDALRQKGRVQDALRQKGRVQEGREPTPSAAIIDSQSVASR